MNIYLIALAQDATTRTPDAIRIPQIALMYLAALTPSKHSLRVVEEEDEPIDFEYDCDLVALSFMTASAIRAYQVAREFKRRGKTIVMGGIHPTVMPDEALLFADAVVIGEAEGVWVRLLEDFENGRLKRKYHDPEPDLSKYPLPRRDITNYRNLFHAAPVVTSRGCPYSCEFCSVHEVFGRTLRHVPIDMVIEDIKNTGHPIIVFLDDNIMGRPKYSKQLFRAITQLKKRWVGQASISFVKDSELMDLTVESGCAALFIGFETVSEEKMKQMPKMFSKLEETERAIAKLQRHGIHIHASMIVGFDEDPESIFDDMYKFLLRNNVGSVSFNILTPYPGTRVFKRMEEEGRLLTKDWRYYNHCTVTYQTKNIVPEELTRKNLEMIKRFYSYYSIIKRLPTNLHHPFFYLAVNLANHWNYSSFSAVTLDRINRLVSDVKSGIYNIVELIDSLGPASPSTES
jgi:radical SAM superfamily enzyme YgiQ (UPF0313 family)